MLVPIENDILWNSPEKSGQAILTSKNKINNK